MKSIYELKTQSNQGLKLTRRASPPHNLARRLLYMKLSKVIFEMYQLDFDCFEEHSDFFELDREVRLEFEDHVAIYVSWTEKPTQHCIGFKEGRWNMNELDHIKNVSELSMFSSIIGQECSFEFLEDEHQILHLKGTDESIYFSSQEKGSWAADVVHISKDLPSISS